MKRKRAAGFIPAGINPTARQCLLRDCSYERPLMLPPPTIASLKAGDWERLCEAAERFEEAARQRSDVELDPFLPPVDDPLYGVVLQELVKTDLELRCRRGQAVALEWYLERYPALGEARQL